MTLFVKIRLSVVPVKVVGGAAGCVAILVLWMILTRPLALLQAVVP